MALFVSGLAIAPTMITTMALIEAHVPHAKLTEGMTWISTGLAVGIAVGSSVTGWVVDTAGAQTGYVVSVSAGVAAAAVAFAGYRRLTRPAQGRCQQSMGTATAGQSSKERTAWHNWAGNITATPARTVTPASVGELQETVRRAAEDGLRVKAVGTGHSFTAAAATDGVLVRPQALAGIRSIDRAAGTVTVAAGTVLKDLNQALAAAGLSLTNMGDIMEQTVSGATSTGTHGTGRDSASIAAQIRGLELVTADGRLLTCSEKENPEVFAAARLGIGALGIVTAITFAVEPIFFLTAREEPMGFDRVTAEFEEHFAENEHFEFYWFPHTGNCNTKRNNRSQGPAAPPGPVSAWIEDELLSNGLFQAVNSLGRAVPATIPSIARVASRALSARTYTDIPYKVFTSPAGCASWRWSTPSRAGRSSRRCGSCGRWSTARGCGSASPWRCGRPRRTTSRCRRPPGATRRTSRCTCTRTPRTAPTSPRPRPSSPRTAAVRTGARCTRGTPGTSRRPTRVSASSSRCATAWTPTGSSATTTCGASWGTESVRCQGTFCRAAGCEAFGPVVGAGGVGGGDALGVSFDGEAPGVGSVEASGFPEPEGLGPGLGLRPPDEDEGLGDVPGPGVRPPLSSPFFSSAPGSWWGGVGRSWPTLRVPPEKSVPPPSLTEVPAMAS